MVKLAETAEPFRDHGRGYVPNVVLQRTTDDAIESLANVGACSPCTSRMS